MPRWAGGEFLGYVGTATDIHERQADGGGAAPSPRQSFRELADSAPVLIWTTDDDGLVTFVNRGLAGVHGHHARGGARRHAGRSAFTPTTPRSVLASWRRRSGGAQALGARVPPAPRTTATTAGSSTAACRATRAGASSATWAPPPTSTSASSMEERLREVYEREHTVAETLQRSLLPERLPAHRRAWRWPRATCPPAAAPPIGGDWYDAIELADGRVALVVGDVVGHGLRAAAMMGQLRNAFRAYALVETSPAEVAGAAEPPARERASDEVMATALYLVLDREHRRGLPSRAPATRRRWCWSRDGAALPRGRALGPAGRGRPGVFREASALLAPGATLLLYTDGLVERRDTPLDDRLGQLPGGGRRGRRRARGHLRPGAEGVLGARTRRSTTWRCSPCARSRRRAERLQPVAAGRARGARRRCAGGSAASSTPPARRGRGASRSR